MLREVWDIIFLFGEFYILKIGLALFKIVKKQLMEDKVGIYGGFNLMRKMTSQVTIGNLTKVVFKSSLISSKYSSLEDDWVRKIAKEILNARKKKAGMIKNGVGSKKLDEMEI
jgi:hypothetical protein